MVTSNALIRAKRLQFLQSPSMERTWYGCVRTSPPPLPHRVSISHGFASPPRVASIVFWDFPDVPQNAVIVHPDRYESRT